MMQHQRKRKYSLTTLILVALVAAALGAAVATKYHASKEPAPPAAAPSAEQASALPSAEQASAPPTVQELYHRAVVDAMTIEPDELLPLITLAEDAPLCSWKDGRTLLLTWHSYPDSYVPGQDFTLSYGAVWTFTDKEIRKRFREEKERGVTDWDTRLRQLIGVPPDRKYTHFTAMWTRPEDILRPGYSWRLEQTVGTDGFPEKPDAGYKAWFDGNIIWSYFDSAYPWTRLGYTYDWGGGGESDYGLSEFLILKDAVVTVEFTLTTEDFIRWLDS